MNFMSTDVWLMSRILKKIYKILKKKFLQIFLTNLNTLKTPRTWSEEVVAEEVVSVKNKFVITHKDLQKQKTTFQTTLETANINFKKGKLITSPKTPKPQKLIILISKRAKNRPKNFWIFHKNIQIIRQIKHRSTFYTFAYQTPNPIFTQHQKLSKQSNLESKNAKKAKKSKFCRT